MAKPRPVPGIDPDRRLRPNARRTLAVRIDEVYAYDGLVADPANVTELHDMRIACKRLRYLLEIFAVAFPGVDLDPFLGEVKGLQDLLGDIHDRDVQIPMLEEHLAWLTAREAGAARRLVAEAGARPPRRRRGRPGGPADEAAFRAFQRQLEIGRRAGERPGVHALIARRRRERDELFRRFTDEWRRLKRERFRARLQEALGIDA